MTENIANMRKRVTLQVAIWSLLNKIMYIIYGVDILYLKSSNLYYLDIITIIINNPYWKQMDQQIQDDYMSESEDFQITAKNPSFFSGFNSAPLLNSKQKKLRSEVCQNSYLQSKQTSLDEKVSRVRQSNQNNLVQKNNKDIAKISVIVEGRQSQSKNKNKKIKHEEQFDQTHKTFEDLRLIRPLLKVIGQVQYTKPTPVQELTIPVILTGRDVVASAVTGSGKTAAFLLPILQRYYNAAAVGYIRSLIVTPTRQLALQIYEEFEKLNKYIRIQGTLVIGASSIQKQETSLRNNPELVIGTPGRIIDILMNSRSVGMENLQIIVFDEADKLLELGFEAEAKQIMKMINPEVQTILFSATIGEQVKKLSAETTRKPIRILANPDNKTAEKLHQQVIKLHDSSEEYREAVLLTVLLNLYQEKVLIFFKTKKQCHRMSIIMNLLGVSSVCELHGNLSQTQRLQAFLKFKEGSYQYMFATDLAARGLDIKEIKTVINFQLPTQLTRYIHRIGRTARAGNIGTSLTLCDESECKQLKKMSRKTGDRLFRVNIEDKAVKEQLRVIQSLQQSINSILQEEREEKQIRKADIEIKKLENINQNQAEIYSKPKKEWFMSEAEKKKIQEQAKIQSGVVLEPKESQKNKFDKKKGKNIPRNGIRPKNKQQGKSTPRNGFRPKNKQQGKNGPRNGFRSNNKKQSNGKNKNFKTKQITKRRKQ